MMDSVMQIAETDPNEEVFKGAQSAFVGKTGSRGSYEYECYQYYGNWTQRFLKSLNGKPWTEVEQAIKSKVPPSQFNHVMKNVINTHLSRTVKPGLYSNSWGRPVATPGEFNINLDGIFEYHPDDRKKWKYPKFPCGTSDDFFIDYKTRIKKSPHGGYVRHDYHDMNLKWTEKYHRHFHAMLLDRYTRKLDARVKHRSNDEYDHWSSEYRTMNKKEIRDFLNKYKDVFTDETQE